MSNFRRRRAQLGTKAYPGTKNDETFFIIAMGIAGFFTFGITWIALLAYFISTAKN